MEKMEEFGSAAGHQDPRRTLLVIYIHGFMGNDTSFQRFPAHMHEFLRDSLEDSHAVHTKIYPRYKTYRTIDVATENFSRWLEPHEGPNTDVVLVGHSMGGLLAADVVLLPSRNGIPGAFRHRILGTVSLDSPFLGLHPGIVSAGIASLFRKSPEPPGPDAWADAGAAPLSPHFPPLSPESSLSPEPSLHSDLGEIESLASAGSSSGPPSYFSRNSNEEPSTALSSIISIGRSATAIGRSDPFYNPPFFNDVQFKDRGFLKNVWHFAKKRKIEGENILEAATDHIVRHLQFGKCLADIKGLHARYDAIRRLEDEDMVYRVRFVNYYTASTGRVKTPKPGSSREGSRPPSRASNSGEARSRGSSPPRAAPTSKAPAGPPGSSPISTPRISIEDHSNVADPKAQHVSTEEGSEGKEHMHEKGLAPTVNQDADQELDSGGTSPEMRSISPRPMSPEPEDEPTPLVPPPLPARSDASPAEAAAATATAAAAAPGQAEAGPPIPAAPQEPAPLEIPDGTAPEERKRLDKEHRQAWKAYEGAVKARVKAIKERDKAAEKERARREKEEQRRQKEEQKRLQQEQKRREKEDKERAKKATQGQAQQQQPQQQPQVDVREDGGGSSDKATQNLVLRPQAEAATAAAAAVEAAVGGGSQQLQPDDTASRGQPAAAAGKEAEKKRKPRKFCMLPRKRSNGSRDSCWIEVYMEGMDEIGAHCGLFFPGPHYEKLIGDVGMRIQSWVHEDASRRAITAVS